MAHTPGAIEAARIIMAGRKMIDTEYGRKTAEGVAALIDDKTAAPDLLAACEAFAAARTSEELHAALKLAQTAISKASPPISE